MRNLPQRAFQRLIRNVAKTGEDHAFESIVTRDFARCDFGGLIDRKPIGAATDRGKSNRTNSVRSRQIETVPITRRQQVRLSAAAALPHRTHSVNHIFCGKAIAASEPSLTGRAAADLAAFLQELGAGSAMNRAIDSAAAEEGGVRGVDDRVNRELRDVHLLDFELRHLPSLATMSNSAFVTGCTDNRVPFCTTTIFSRPFVF